MRLAAVAGLQNKANLHRTFTYCPPLQASWDKLGDWPAWRVRSPIIANLDAARSVAAIKVITTRKVEV